MESDLTSLPTSSTRAWLITIGCWLVLAAGTGIALWHLRNEVVEAQKRELGLLSLALADEMDRGLRGVEEGLNALRTELQEGRLLPNGADAARALHTRANLMPLVGTLWLTQLDGRLISASDAVVAPDISSFSPPLKEHASAAVSVSRPFVNAPARPAERSGVASGTRLADKATLVAENATLVADQATLVADQATLVALAVRFDDASGRFSGWIFAGLPATTLLGAFGAALPAADARMLVFRSDGVRLIAANASAPAQDEALTARRLADQPSMEVRTFRDGSENLVSLQSLPRYGIKVVVSRDLSAVLASWRGAAELAAMLFTLLFIVIAVALHFVLRADRRRSMAQRTLQSHLARAGKLQSLGTLAGGVAHDFNNVLAGIFGFAEMAHDAAKPGSDQARHLNKLMQAAMRGKALVERILAFSRGGARTSTVFELEPVVEEALTMLSTSLRPGDVLERELAAQGACLRGDATRAFEAVMNLCTNAMQAVATEERQGEAGHGGMFSVRTRRLTVSAPRVLSHSVLAAGRYVMLTVSDHGPGITPEVMEHLFEPFFTTRGAQLGTGLGLAVVHGVVGEFDGAIDVQSVPGEGACFTLYFPECVEAEMAPAAMPEVLTAGAGQRIMLIDDEPELVAMMLEMLTALGYDPVGFSDSTVALNVLRADPLHFSAVITDEAMPTLSGTDFVKALRAEASTPMLLPVLLITGYGGALMAARASAAGVNRVLGKPVQRAELSRALAELLRLPRSVEATEPAG